MNEKSSNLFPIRSLKRASTKRFDFLSIDPDYFENQNCLSCRKASIQGKILYENANNYLTEFLDIETLFLNYQEVDMLKKILFDMDQRKIFEFLSRLSNLPKVFSVINRNEKGDLFENYNEFEIFRILEQMIERGDENDLRLINFSKKFFKN